MEAHRRDAMESFKLRAEFSRQMYRRVLRLVFIASFILAALCAVTIYLGFYGFKPEHYFTTSPSGKIVELQYRILPPPLSHPSAPLAPHPESQQVNGPVSPPTPLQPVTPPAAQTTPAPAPSPSPENPAITQPAPTSPQQNSPTPSDAQPAPQ